MTVTESLSAIKKSAIARRDRSEPDWRLHARRVRYPVIDARLLCLSVQTSSGLNKTPAMDSAGYGFTKTFLNPIIITAHLRAARSNANRCYSWCR